MPIHAIIVSGINRFTTYPNAPKPITLSISNIEWKLNSILCKGADPLQKLEQFLLLIVHYVVPFMMIFDWILLDKKCLYKITEPLLWIGLPYVYLIFALVRGYFGGSITPGGSKYPYFFLDIEKVGLIGVIKYTLGLTVFFIILGYLILGIDKVLGKMVIKKTAKNGYPF